MPVNKLFSSFIRRRMKEISRSLSNPVETQNEVYSYLIERLAQTSFGLEHKATNNSKPISLDEFKSLIPVRSYDHFKPWIKRAEEGERGVIWPGEVKWFAKSSGTTSDRSKQLPVTEEFLKQGHYKGGRDLLSLYCDQVPEAPLYSGKHLIIGGSTTLNENNQGSYIGDLSAIIVRNLPPWVEMRRTPGRDITLHDDWNVKVKLMAERVAREDVRILAGVPSWMLVVCKEVLNVTGAKTLNEVWPNLWLYMHGGVGFEPYKKEFERLLNSPNLSYMETYNASEGFFGIQDKLERDDMALLVNHGVFYEFIPITEYDSSNEHPSTLQLSHLKIGQDYALVISTYAGLWRYDIGDVIRITSTDPFRFKIVGRTTNYINVVGEELMIAQTENALATVASLHNVNIKEFTAAPRFEETTGSPIGHQWLVELQNEASIVSPELFAHDLDDQLRAVNSDYDAKRTGDYILKRLQLEFAPSGTFEVWLQKKNKLGGQHKIPRLSNSRKILDEILSIIGP